MEREGVCASAPRGGGGGRRGWRRGGAGGRGGGDYFVESAREGGVEMLARYPLSTRQVPMRCLEGAWSMNTAQ
eukprot:61103-Rhodomonas_salina.1